jgi:tetratricopeptide (TPR) repeat protein
MAISLTFRTVQFSWCMFAFLCAYCSAQQTPRPDSPVAQTAQASEAASSDFSHARTLMQQGKIDDAIAELQTLQSATPAVKGIELELGTAYYKKGNYVKAIGFLRKVTASDPNNREAAQLLGLSYYLNGYPADAIPVLEKVQEWFPRANVDASYILGVCYIQSKDYDHARRAFATMYNVTPDSAAAYLFTARMLFRQEFDPVAEQYGKKAVALDPNLPLAHFLLGELYLYKSRIPEAVAEFQKELTINPGHAATYYKLGDANSRLQNWDEAERLLQRSIWLDATSTGPYILMGKVLLKKGEAELAVRALRRAEAMDPANAMPHQLLGQAYRVLGQTEDAERELRMANQANSAQELQNSDPPEAK